MATTSTRARQRSGHTYYPKWGVPLYCFYTLETDCLKTPRFFYPLCKREVAIEWALSTLKDMKATHRGPQRATLYLGDRRDHRREQIQTFKRDYSKEV